MERLRILVYLLLFPVLLSAQTYISTTGYPFEQESYSGQTYQGDLESADFILPTSDGGYLLVGSVEFDAIPNDYDGRIVKIAADGTKLTYNLRGSTGEDYFYGAVEVGTSYYVVGMRTYSNGVFPMVMKYDATTLDRQMEVNFPGLPNARFLTIEVSYSGRLLIGGYEPGSGGQTSGFYMDVPLDLLSTATIYGNVGDKVGKITRSADGNYYVFGTTYDPTQSCFDPQDPPTAGRTPVYTDAGNVLVTKINQALAQIWQREVGGDTPDSFIDGVATPDGGFAVIGQTECLAGGFGEDTGPGDIADQNGLLDPYWLFKGAANRNRQWEKSLFSANAIDYLTSPFGLVNSCQEGQFVVANVTYGFVGNANVDLYAVTQEDQDFRSGTSDPDFRDNEGKDIAIGNNGDIVVSGIYEGIQQDFGFFRFSSESTCGIAATCASCVDEDPFLPAPYQCDDFEAYSLGALSPQANDWTRWPNSTGDGLIETISGGDQVLAIRAGDGDSDVLFHLNGPNGPNETSGRHRLSWEMFVEPGAAAYYNVQYDKNSLGTTGNWAFQMFFNADGTGRIERRGQVDIPFTYPMGQRFRIAHIIDLDQDVMEFWLNHEFQTAVSYSAAVASGITVGIGVLNFYGEVNGDDDFWVDQICIRTTGQTANCGSLGLAGLNLDESVCTEHGIRYDDACQAGNVGLYHGQEYGECISICDFNAVVIGRNDRQGYTAALSTANEVPTLLYSEDCVVNRFDGEVPYPLYGDIYVLYNDQTQPINVPGNVPGVEFFVFRCLDGSGGGQACVTNPDDDQPPGDYYIVAVGPGPVGYTFVVTPSSVCELSTDNPRLSCSNNSFSGDFTSGATNVLDISEAYQSCYGGGRTYAGAERVFQLTIMEPSLVDVTLSTSQGAGGLFLLDANCGTGCISYVEAPEGGGDVLLDSLSLTPGNYYLVVDQETPIGSFDLGITCVTDNVNVGFGGFFVTIFDNPSCQVSENEEEDHQIAIEITNPDNFVPGQTLFLFNRAFNSGLGTLNNDSLSQRYNGNEQLVFNLPRDLAQSPENRCSFINEDSLQLYVIQNPDLVFTAVAQRMSFTEPGPGVTASGRFVSGERSVIESFENTPNTVFIQVPTEIQLLQSGAPKRAYWQVSSSWLSRASEDWIRINVRSNAGDPSDGQEARGLGNSSVEVSAFTPNNSYQLRRGFITVEAEDGGVSQRIQVEQLGRCETPQISGNLPTPIQLCAGESTTLDIEVGPGAAAAYTYRWSTGQSGSPSITVMPDQTSEYTVTVTQPMGGRCSASNTFTFNVEVQPAVSAPLSNGDVAICAGESATLTVAVSPGETVNWYDAPGGGTLLRSNSTSFQTALAGTYYAEAVRTAGGCVSPARTAVNVSVAPALQLSLNNPPATACQGTNIPLSVTATGGGTGQISYSWRRNGQLLGNGSSLNYSANELGTNTITIVVVRGACTATETFAVEVAALPSLSLTQPNEEDCAADLQTYSVDFETDGVVSTPASGQLSTDNGIDYVLSGIPRGEDVELEVSNPAGCMLTVTVSSPACLCPTDIAAPLVNGGVQNLPYCGNEEPPLLVASVIDPAVQTVNWYGGDGQELALAALEYQPLSDGVYFAETVDQRNDCRSLNRTRIVVELIPPITVNTSPTSLAACTGDNVRLSATASGGAPPLSFQWTDSEGILGVGINLDWIANAAGTKTIQLRVTDAESLCSATVDFTIAVAPNPIINMVTASCASDLLSYQVELNTTGQTVTTNNGQAVVSNGDAGMFVVSGIPIGENITVRAQLGDCFVEQQVAAPDCDCENDIQPPVINGGSTTVQICAGDGFPELEAMVASPETYTVDWYGPNGQPLAMGTNIYQPLEPGIYLAETRNRENNCISSTRTSFTIESIPVIQLVATTTEVTACRGEEVTLRAAAVGGVAPLSYTWYRDSEVIGSGLELSGLADEVGVYQVALQIMDAAGVCGLQEVFTITVLPQPTISLASNRICADDLTTYSFEVTATGAEVFTNLPEAMVTPNGSSSYLISGIPVGRAILVTTRNPNMARDCSDDIIVESPNDCSCGNLSLSLPTPQATELSICQGEEIPSFILTAVEEGLIPLWYLSSSPQATIVQEGGLSYRASAAGNVYVRVKDEESNCVSDDVLELTLRINTPPQVNVGEDIAACIGANIVLQPSIIGGLFPLTYTWTGAGEFSASDIENPTFTPTTNTTLQLVVVDANGCAATSSVEVSALPLPSANLEVSVPIRCANEATGQLTVVPVSGTLPFTYEWANGIGTTATVADLPAGTYTVSFTDANGCSNSLNNELTDPPSLEYTVLEQMDGMNNSGALTPGTILLEVSGGVSPYLYRWENEAGMVVSDSVRVVAAEAGFYRCLITDSNGCTVQTEDLEILIILVGLADPRIKEGDLRLYPNPTQGRVTLEFLEPPRGPVDVRVIDVLGRKVSQQRLSYVGGQSVELDLAQLPAGTYWLLVEWSDQFYRVSITKI